MKTINNKVYETLNVNGKIYQIPSSDPHIYRCTSFYMDLFASADVPEKTSMLSSAEVEKIEQEFARKGPKVQNITLTPEEKKAILDRLHAKEISEYLKKHQSDDKKVSRELDAISKKLLDAKTYDKKSHYDNSVKIITILSDKKTNIEKKSDYYNDYYFLLHSANEAVRTDISKYYHPIYNFGDYNVSRETFKDEILTSTDSINILINSGTMKRIVTGFIRKIAYSHWRKATDTLESMDTTISRAKNNGELSNGQPYMGYEACRRICESINTDPLYDDLYQVVCMELWQMFNTDRAFCYQEMGKDGNYYPIICFNVYESELNHKEYSEYFRVLNAIQRELYQNSTQKGRVNKMSIQSLNDYATTKCSGKHKIDKDRPQYIDVVACPSSEENLAKLQQELDYMYSFIKAVHPKQGDLYCLYMSLFIDGYNYKQIAQKTGMSYGSVCNFFTKWEAESNECFVNIDIKDFGTFKQFTDLTDNSYSWWSSLDNCKSYTTITTTSDKKYLKTLYVGDTFSK